LDGTLSSASLWKQQEKCEPGYKSRCDAYRADFAKAIAKTLALIDSIN
jgi:hypothetical protein